jgi:hypothetical protein
MFIGAGAFMAYGYYQVRKIRKARDTLLDELKKKAQEMDDKRESIKQRLVKASELAQAQTELRAQAEMPSKNSLHSRYKNGLVEEITNLEYQKLDILKTVLAEGFDPMITVLNDAGGKEEMALSVYVNEALSTLNKVRPGGAAPEPEPNLPTEAKKIGKFVIYKGGKDDGTSH